MIEGRPRESLVQYENPIEVSHHYCNRPRPPNEISLTYRSQQDRTLRIHSRRHLGVSIGSITSTKLNESYEEEVSYSSQL